MGFPVLVRCHLYVKLGPCLVFTVPSILWVDTCGQSSHSSAITPLRWLLANWSWQIRQTFPISYLVMWVINRLSGASRRLAIGVRVTFLDWSDAGNKFCQWNIHEVILMIIYQCWTEMFENKYYYDIQWNAIITWSSSQHTPQSLPLTVRDGAFFCHFEI